MAAKSTGKRRDTTLKKVLRIIAIVIMIGIITGCILACALTAIIFKQVADEGPINFEQVKLSYTTTIYAPDATGNPLPYLEIQTGQDRTWIDYANIPAHTRDALIAVEDKRFREHKGVDWKRTIGASLNLIFNFYGSEQGGSTITQQVVRNLTNDNQRRLDRKAREILRALQLEQNYTKDQILEMYLNTAFFGNNAYGIEAAAQTYFSKDAKDLSIAESAAIVGITKSPTAYEPYKNPDKNKKRREHILYEMGSQGLISKKAYDEALAEELVFQREVLTGNQVPVYNYFVDHLVETVISDFQTQKGYTYEEAENLVNRGGVRIYSTMNVDAQNKVTAYYSDVANFPPVNNATYPQSAFVAISPEGAILAMAGGIGEKKGSREFNRATQAQRQSGSSIKPLTAYLMGFENEIIKWSTLMDDHPIQVMQNGVQVTWPVNFQGKYEGMMTIERAIRESRNTIPVKLVDMVGAERVLDFLIERLGFTSLVKRQTGQAYDDANLSSMALGGMTYGVTPLEMAGGYQIYANGGKYTKPYCYTKVVDARDNVLLEADTTQRQVITPETATIMNQLLQKVTLPGGTGNGARWGNLPVAGKTGTATDNYDQWFMGVTPYMVTATWLGFDEPETIQYYSYAPPVIFRTLGAQLHEGFAPKEFPVWGAVVQKEYCTESGEAAVEGCTSRATGWYAENMLPVDCPQHKESAAREEREDSSTSSRVRLPSASSSKSSKPGKVQLPNGLWISTDE